MTHPLETSVSGGFFIRMQEADTITFAMTDLTSQITSRKWQGVFLTSIAVITAAVVSYVAYFTPTSYVSMNTQPATSTSTQPATTTVSASTDDQQDSPDQTEPSHPSYIEVTQGCGSGYGGSCLNVRSSPTTDSSVVTQLRNGIVLKVGDSVTNEGLTWYKIVFDEWLRYPDRVSEDWYVAADYVHPVSATARSSEAPHNIESDKRIVVDLSEQKLYAYEGEELFMEQIVSTGLPLYPTPRGSFPIYKMTPSRYMQGPIPDITDEHYDLPGVPWDLYFTYQGAVIHGAYWHDNFGHSWSHGCVNLPPEKAEELYRWAELGATVEVRD